MAKIPIFDAIRIIPRDDEFLNRKLGARGEIFYDRDSNSLRLYDGRTTGGIGLAKSDLTNVGLEDFRKKSVESKLATVVYNVTVAGPQSPDTGNKYNLNAVYRPIPNFVVGYTYVFVQDDQTNVYFPNSNNTTPNPHPLNFSADNLSGQLGNGTSYLTDVRYFLNGNPVTQAVYNSSAFNTATARQVQITVTNSTPATLYYWCWNHLAMGNEIAVADPGSGSETSTGGTSVTVSDVVPTNSVDGNLWLDTNTGILYVYINDGDSEQWIQPIFPYPDITGLATENYVDAAVSNVSVDLTGLATENYVDAAVSSVTATSIGLGNVTNESKATMFTSPTFTGTVSGITAASVGLGNVTNESKATMFTNPAFTESVGIGGAASVIQGTGKSGTYLDVKGFIQVMPSTGAASIDMGSGNGYRVAVLETANSITPYLGIYLSNSSTSSSVNTVAIFRPAETESTSTTTGALTVVGGVGISKGLTVGGLTTLQQSTELLNTKTSATGTVTHDFSTGAIWYHSSISANFTANFTNVPTTNNRAISIALVLIQGATPYIPNVVQIAGTPVTINWQDNETPTGNANKRDLVSFTLLRVGDAWSVIGSLSTYG